MRLITGILAAALLLAPLSQGNAGREEGVMQEFRQVEEDIRAQKSTPEERQRQLEENLLRAVRNSIRRHFYDQREDYYKDLSMANVFYENPTSPLVYYVKHKDFIVRYDFARDPEIFVQAPTYEKMLIVPKGDAHSDDPAPAGG